ncbi:hypothetical protein Lepil_0021 [Leptonema illini DSM 21528]|uniref:Plasmid stabilization system n=1 Tax=Leptonema illini DSM 21528 TaxID=929563 RepID=H2CGQ7_9LEPT|nr:hypothetical protein Lepil_0021 [Leptonema illini DSM 21528]
MKPVRLLAGARKELYAAVSQRIRCASTESFPYNLFYSVLSDEILVISIAHQRRRPRRWDDPSPH